MGIYLSVAGIRKGNKALFFTIWAAWMFLFLSLSSGKISKYMLPVLPALSFMASEVFLEERSRYRTSVLLLLGVLFPVLGGMLFFYKTGMYPELYPERVFLGALSVALAAAIIFSIWKGRAFYAFSSMIVFMVLAYGMANMTVYRKWNPYKSPKQLAERIRPYVRDGSPWVYYGSMRGTYVYYVGSFAVHVNEHDTRTMGALSGELKRFYVLTRKRDMKEVDDALPGVKTLFEEKIGDTVMVFAGYGR